MYRSGDLDRVFFGAHKRFYGVREGFSPLFFMSLEVLGREERFTCIVKPSSCGSILILTSLPAKGFTMLCNRLGTGTQNLSYSYAALLCRYFFLETQR